MKFTNTFLVDTLNIAANCRNSEGILQTMRHMMITTVRRIKAMQVKDLFKSLVYHKISTTEVNNLCNKICQKMTSKSKLNLLKNMVMKWKYADAQKAYKTALFCERKLWKEYSRLYSKENIIDLYNRTWFAEKKIVMKRCRTRRKEKVKWLLATYKKKEDTSPDYINGICVKDVVLGEEFVKEPRVYGNVQLDSNEVAAIQIPPKFALYNKIDIMDCEAEIEKCLSSIRRTRCYKDNSSDIRTVFNSNNKVLDLRKMRATDLPFCSNVILPKPVQFEEEVKLQNLKHELNSVVQSYKTNNKDGKNISEEQHLGLKSLIERRNNKEIVIFQTDKSGTMSVDSVDNYIKEVGHHMENDEVIDEVEFGRIERKINAHSKFWCNMLNAGTETGDVDRIKTSIRTCNSDYASVYFYRKDHKPASESTNSDGSTILSHPFRPLCDVSDSFSHKFSYMLCILLREVTHESNTVCTSSEDLIAKINELNASGSLNKNCVIGSMDVKSLYPNLDITSVIEVVGQEFYVSDLVIEGVDYEEVGLYIALGRSREYIRKKKLTAVCPTRRSNRNKPLITGSGSILVKEDRFKPWFGRARAPNEVEKRNMLTEAIMIALKLILENHVYKFHDVIRKQSKGGPIGLDLTEVVAKIFMNWWDKKLLRKLDEHQCNVLLYARYVDDINMCMDDISPAVWNQILYGDAIPLETTQQLEPDERTFQAVGKIADSITKCVKVETDFPSNNIDKKVPVLDLKLWIECTNGTYTILYENYIKPMASRYVILHNSALSMQSKRTILTQQCLKVLLNCSEQLTKGVRESHIEYFVKRMQLSGYDKKFRGEIVSSAQQAYLRIKKAS